MPYSHSFTGIVPFARFGTAGPWTRILIEESTDGDPATFGPIDDQAIPLDPTPETPNTLDVTTEAAMLPAGVYRFRFVDADAVLSPYTDPVASPLGGIPDPSLRPSLQQIGAILRARTRSDATGGEIGTFNETTRPTGDEVNSYIDQAIPDVRLRLPADVPDDLEPFARRLVALRAAMFVELSYDPDNVGADSTYGRLQELFDSGLTALHSALDDRGQDTSTGGRMVVATVQSPYSGSSPLDDIFA